MRLIISRLGPNLCAHYAATGEIVLNDFAALFTNPWLLRQYPHTMLGAVVLGLAAAAPAQLAIDSTGLMPLGSDHVQAAGSLAQKFT